MIQTEPTVEKMSSKECPRTDRGATIFVGTVWMLMALFVLAYVIQYASNVPWNDDWDLVPTLTGVRAVTPRWLWSQHNEHRILLPRLVHVGLAKLTGIDFRAGMYFSVFVLAALSLAMILVARRLRGRTAYSDAFFPLALLSLGQYENLLWSFQVTFALSTLLAGTLLLVIAVHRDGLLTPRSALLAGICVLLLPLCGANGLALVPALASWLGFASLRSWSSRTLRGRLSALILTAFAVGALAIVGVYFLDYHRPDHHLSPSSLRAALDTCVELLSVSFGISSGVRWHPYLGYGVLSLLVFTAVAAGVAWFRQSQERFRILGLLFFMGAAASLTLGLGWGRAGFGENAGFASRYVILMAPALCCAYFLWMISLPASTARFLQLGLLALAGLMFIPNASDGIQFAKDHRRQMEKFESDLRAGMPVAELAEKHAPFLHHPDLGNLIAARLRMLHYARVGQFTLLGEDAAVVREVPLRDAPVTLNQTTWEDGVGKASGDDPFVVFALAQPELVSAVRLRVSVESTSPTALLEVFWKNSQQNEFAETERRFGQNVPTGPEESVVMIPINDTIDHLRIDPADQPCSFRITEVTLLVQVPDRTTPESFLVEGSLDIADPKVVAGWAWNPKYPDRTVDVDIYDGNVLLATIPADQLREDLAAAGYGDGRHGFIYQPTYSLSGGRPHTIRVRAAGTRIELNGSPKTVIPGATGPVGEVPLTGGPAVLNDVIWKDGDGQGQGDDPYLVFSLKEPQFVASVRLKLSIQNGAGTAFLEAFWRHSGVNDFSERERHVTRSVPTGSEQALSIPINATIDALRIDPDNRPCTFRISEITLLVPGKDAPPAPPQAASGGLVEGFLDTVNEREVRGWAWDRTQPGTPVRVDVYDSEELLATVPADQFRQDLLDARVGEGKHGFTCPLPARLRDGQRHTIRVKVSGTNQELTDSPKVITLARAEGAGKQFSYPELIQQVRKNVTATVAPNATVVVVSKGDDELLKFDGRKGWHFPQDERGVYLGYNPKDAAEAVARLEALRAKGGQYLVFPATAFWWLNHYKDFRGHLDKRYRRVLEDEHCIIYDLGQTKVQP